MILPATSKTILFGLTGGIACGKSFVSSILTKQKVSVVDADEVARHVVQAGSPGLEQLVECFGQDILLENALDRVKLGDMVFGNQTNLDKLNAIMQSLILEETTFRMRVREMIGCKLMCYDAALIIEAGQADLFRPLVLVSCSAERQLERLMKRGYTKEQAEVRINVQLPLAKKLEVADVIIDTNGTKNETEAQVVAFLNGLQD
jgi:dephospho-CoA kinase